MSFLQKNYLSCILRFRNEEMELIYTQSKRSHEKAFFFVLCAFALIFTLTNWIINPKNRTQSDPISYASRVAFIIFLIIMNVAYRLRPRYGDSFLFVISTVFFFLFGESSKMNVENGIASTYISVGICTELLAMILIIARVGLIKNLIFISAVNILCSFRYLPFQENFENKFFPLFYFVFNLVLLVCLTYAFEKKDRERFYIDKKNEFSLNCFKELIRDVLPNPIAIVKGDAVLFGNQEALRAFNCRNIEDIAKHIEMTLIASKNIYSNSSSKHNSMDKQNEAQVLLPDNKSNRQFSPLDDGSLHFPEKKNLWSVLKKTENIMMSNDSDLKVLKGKHESNGSIIYYDIKVKRLIWEDEYAFLLTFSENEALIKIHKLKEQSDYKDKVLASVSHDLRTPLNGIMGMLNESLTVINDKVINKNLTVAYRSANYLLFMINDILDYHQISNGKLRLNFESFSLWSLIQDVSKLIKFQAKLKGLSFLKENMVTGIDKQALVRSDPNRLRQVILNLLGNALKFTPSGSITISLEEYNEEIGDPDDEEDGEDIDDDASKGFLIKVKDTGIGIKSEDQKRLFTMFGKLDSSSKQYNKNGVGLGLAISQDLVKILNDNKRNGEIRVISKVGEGSCFYFILLSRLESDFEENFNSEISEPEINKLKIEGRRKSISSEMLIGNREIKFFKEPRNELKVLIVDDDQINIYVTCSYLKQFTQIKFDTASDGLQAIQKIKANAANHEFYDIILMDCNMPLMNGFEATAEVREMTKSGRIPDTYIIACTANASNSDYQDCFRIGMNDYLTKPYSKMDLIAKFKKFTESKNLLINFL